MAERYVCRELKADELGKLDRLLERAPRDETLGLRRIRGEAEDRERWWFGALGEDQRLRGVMAVRGHTGELHAERPEAAAALGEAMLIQARMHGGGTSHRHELHGDKATLDAFWRTFQAVGRQVVADQPQWLMASGPSVANPTKRLQLSVATAADERLVSDFVAEHTLEVHGRDPRRTEPQAHAASVRAALAEGRALVGREGPKAVFAGQVRALDAQTCLLDTIYVPPALRGRKRLVGGAFAQATTVGPASGKALLFYAEGELLLAAAERAGFTSRCAYRRLAMVG